MIIDRFDGEYRWLSNFWPCEVTPQGEHTFEDTYRSAEHAYQASKCARSSERLDVRAAPTPGQAKLMTRNMSLWSDWDDIKLVVMKEVVEAKFLQNPDLAQKLIATGDAILVEGNHWHDNYWGRCTCSKCVDILGKNHLGDILMDVRSNFRRAINVYGTPKG